MTRIVLVLLGVLVLAVTLFPPQRGSAPPEAAAPAVAPQTGASPPLTDPDAFDVSARLAAAPGLEQQTVQAEVGDRVELIVTGDELDSVALGDLAMEDLEPGIPARFELLADTPGAYPVTLVNENRRIGVLQVR